MLGSMERRCEQGRPAAGGAADGSRLRLPPRRERGRGLQDDGARLACREYNQRLVRPQRPDDRALSAGAIFEELQAGSHREENFHRLFDLYYGRVFRFFAKRGIPPEDCRDLAQDTFIGIYRGIGAFRGEAELDAWIFKIAANLYRKRLRWGAAEKRAGTVVTPETLDDGPADLPAEGDAPDSRVLDRERSRLLRAAVQTLPDQMRNCLILRVYYDLKYREIAAAMRISIETVKAHLFRARERIKGSLGDYFEDLDL
jgi:RNA polymerase sigma-70 factor, ECF subfamily